MAEALRYWLPKVIQAVQPWMSANDIEKGTRWRTDIASELEQSSIGIICLTPENLSSAWLNFEAGALSKQQQNTFVCTFLYDLEPADVREPLAQFQSTKAQRDDVRKLIQTINNALGEKKLPEPEISESFDVWWNKLEQRLKDIPATQNSPEPRRTDREILEEMLGLLRAQSRANKNAESDAQYNEFRRVSDISLPRRDIKLLADFYGESESDIGDLWFPSEESLFDLLKHLRKKKSMSRAQSSPSSPDTLTSRSDKAKLNEDSNS